MGVGGISVWQLLIILAIVVMLFGTKRLRTLGSDLGSAVKGFRKSKVTIHLTNQAFLRLSSSAKRSVKKALRRGRTVRAKVTVTARNRSGSSNRVTRSVTLKD